MKKLIIVLVIIGVAGYIFYTKFGAVLPDTEDLQGNFFTNTKNEIGKSAKNLTDEINRIKTGFTETKEKVEGTIEKVENVVDAVNELTE